MRVSALERWWLKVDVCGDNECWPWLASTDRDGYGHFSIRPTPGVRQKVRAHRWGYLQIVGPIPEGMLVCHSCDNPPCCNPAHWWLGSDADNAADRDAKGRTRIRPRVVHSHCKRGHELSGYNLIVDRHGCRVCRVCIQDAQRRSYQRNRQAIRARRAAAKAGRSGER